MGGNLGDQRSIQRRCIAALGERVGNVLAISCAYWNEAIGEKNDSLFMNRCLLIDTSLEPHELLDRLEEMEGEFGRPQEEKGQNLPRTLDLDILLYDDEVIDDERLTIPHPRCHERLFVLLPILEIMADCKHPVSGRTVSELITDLR